MTRIAVGVVVIAIAAFSPRELPAMQLKVVGNQLILSGRVVGDEPGEVTEALAKSPDIDTVVLRNSPGGKCAGRLPGRSAIARAWLAHRRVRLLLFIVLTDVSRRPQSLLHR